MSWLISRALMEVYENSRSSQALVEEYSGGISSGGEPSAPSNGNPTPQAYLSPDKMTAFFRPSRFGMTFRPLTDDLGQDVLTSYLAAFPAKTSAWQERAQGLTVSAAGCGPTWRASLARFDRATSSWRTVQPSLLEDLGECSVTWPRSGMTAAGQCWELPTLGRRTSETDSGLSETWPTPRACSAMAANITPEAIEKAHDRFPNLETVVARRMWPTPNSRDWKDTGATQGNRKSPNLGTQVGGGLNPTWVEWLMGWPLGWTDLKPLATDKCPSAPPPPGASLQET